MQYRFFTIPIREPDEGMAELNRFLAGHRILAVDRQFVQDASNSAWAICISFDSGEATQPGRSASMARRGKVDFKDILSEPEFAVFARLRALRKEKADAEGVPAYGAGQSHLHFHCGQRSVASPKQVFIAADKRR